MVGHFLFKDVSKLPKARLKSANMPVMVPAGLPPDCCCCCWWIDGSCSISLLYCCCCCTRWLPLAVAAIMPVAGGDVGILRNMTWSHIAKTSKPYNNPSRNGKPKGKKPTTKSNVLFSWVGGDLVFEEALDYNSPFFSVNIDTCRKRKETKKLRRHRT